jgi:ABC-type phosphate/phosphonate transport system substrate-binding protein
MSDEAALAELGMYPFTSVRWAWDRLWAAVHDRAPWTPSRLAHSGDVHARWADPDCIVNQMCGWPLVRNHAARHAVVGTFSLTIPDAVGHRYRSVLLARHPGTLDELVATGTRAVANSADSLSGWISLLHATVGPSGAWPGEIEFTSAHVECIRTLAAGRADLACIDPWTLSFVVAEQPDLLAGLHRVGLGPLVPSPAVTLHATFGTGRRDELAAAFEDAVAEPELAPVRSALHVDGFVRTTLDEYRSTLTLATV